MNQPPNKPAPEAPAERFNPRRIPDAVRTAIRKRRLDSGKSYRDIGFEFGVCKTTVEEICKEDPAEIIRRLQAINENALIGDGQGIPAKK